jgi:hypothetical protein
LVLACAAFSANAQVEPAALAKRVSLDVGGMVSAFQPEFAGDWTPGFPTYPVGEASTYPSVGLGVYADIKFTHWVQIEAEGRWLRFNQDPNIFEDSNSNVHQDNYLIGPRVPLPHIWRASPYAKVLAGYSLMNLGLYPGPCSACNVSGRFTDIAFGGGADVRVTRRINLRVIDFEYQYLPTWWNSSLRPYGASVGIAYRVF